MLVISTPETDNLFGHFWDRGASSAEFKDLAGKEVARPGRTEIESRLSRDRAKLPFLSVN